MPCTQKIRKDKYVSIIPQLSNFEFKRRRMKTWIEALKIFNRGKPRFVIPRKGSADYAQVRKIMGNTSQVKKGKRSRHKGKRERKLKGGADRGDMQDAGDGEWQRPFVYPRPRRRAVPPGRNATMAEVGRFYNVDHPADNANIERWRDLRDQHYNRGVRPLHARGG
jgi:hypothetical protein